MSSDDSQFLCVDCNEDTSSRTGIREYYMVSDSVWQQEARMPVHGGMLCIGCLETRIKRQLTPADFIDAPINQGCFYYSRRLASRLMGVDPARLRLDPASTYTYSLIPDTSQPKNSRGRSSTLPTPIRHPPEAPHGRS